MIAKVICCVCRTHNAECILLRDVGDRISFECEICGRYDVSRSALLTSLDETDSELTLIQRAIISHRIREFHDAGQVILLTTDIIKNVVDSGRLPSPALQANNLIKFLGNEISQSGKPVSELPPFIAATIGSANRNRALSLASELLNRGLIVGVKCATYDSPDDIIEVDLTLNGWDLYETTRRGRAPGKIGFIALQFGDAILDDFLNNSIKPAVESIGYNLEDMRDAAEAGIIDNVMRSRIRDAAFVLADLTHANKGAYWEAGYAEGLGKPVIYICEAGVLQKDGTHFDTNHCTTIAWDTKNSSEFSEKLVATLRRSLGLFQ